MYFSLLKRLNEGPKTSKIVAEQVTAISKPSEEAAEPQLSRPIEKPANALVAEVGANKSFPLRHIFEFQYEFGTWRFLGETGKLFLAFEYAFEFHDWEQIPAIFNDMFHNQWHYERKYECDQVLYVIGRAPTGKTVRIKCGPYEQFKRLFNLSDQKVPLIQEEKEKMLIVDGRTFLNCMKIIRSKISSEQELVDRNLWKNLSKEDRLRLAAKLHYKFVLRRKGKRLELYAQKWAPNKKSPDKPYIGLWNEELKKLAEELNIEVRG